MIYYHYSFVEQLRLVSHVSITTSSLHEQITTMLWQQVSFFAHPIGTLADHTIIVLHPALRLNFFKKLGPDEAVRAEIVFKTIYDQYATAAAQHSASNKAHRSTSLQSSSASSFLSLLSLDESDTDVSQEHHVGEWDKYLVLRLGGTGQVNDPLHWWKVCHYYN